MTNAESITRKLAERFEASGLSVEVERTEREPVLYNDGSIMLDGSVTFSVYASDGYGGSFHAAWQTRTTGRRTTAFLCGSRTYGYSTKPTKFEGPRQALTYADMFAR